MDSAFLLYREPGSAPSVEGTRVFLAVVAALSYACCTVCDAAVITARMVACVDPQPGIPGLAVSWRLCGSCLGPLIVPTPQAHCGAQLSLNTQQPQLCLHLGELSPAAHLCEPVPGNFSAVQWAANRPLPMTSQLQLCGVIPPSKFVLLWGPSLSPHYPIDSLFMSL